MAPNDHSALKKELDEFSTKGKEQNSSIDFSKLSTNDFRKIREIALHVMHGNIDPVEISDLNPELKSSLDLMIRHLISLRDKPGLHALEELNPYYTAFSSTIIRDNFSNGSNKS